MPAAGRDAGHGRLLVEGKSIESQASETSKVPPPDHRRGFLDTSWIVPQPAGHVPCGDDGIYAELVYAQHLYERVSAVGDDHTKARKTIS